MTTNTDDYEKPEVDELAPSVTFAKDTPVTPLTDAQALSTVLSEVKIVGVSGILNAKGTALTDVMVARLERHMQFLTGKLGFNTHEEQDEEQITFIETIGNTLLLDYDQYVVVTDHFLQQIRDNKDVFEEGRAYRFMQRLGKKYPTDVLTMYRNYIQLLTQISLNWNRRHTLSRQMDIATAIQIFTTKGKENFTRYFRELQDV